jgi:hypothetical protein
MYARVHSFFKPFGNRGAKLEGEYGKIDIT